MIVIEYDLAKDKFYFYVNDKLTTIYGDYSAIEYLQSITNFSYDLCKSYIYDTMNGWQTFITQ